MDKASLNIIIDKLNEISARLYDEEIDRADASFLIDEVIDDLFGWLKYLK